MATSGSYDYSRTAAQVITAAFENLGEIEPGGTVPTGHSTMALVRLNFIAKQHQGRADGSGGLKHHTRQRVTLLLQEGQQTYLIGPASGDARASALVGRTTISADEAASQTTLSITSNTDTTTYPGTTLTMTASDIVAIEQNDGTLHFTTISGTPSSTMDIAAGLTAAAAAGNYVYWFTARAQRFVHIEAVTLRDENYNETPLTVYRDVVAYQAGVADKYADGDPTEVMIENLRITTRVTLNSQPTDVAKQIIITGWYPSEDYDATTDDIAFPQEAFNFLSWELAKQLAPGCSVRWTPEMEQNRVEARSAYLSLNPEVSDAYFQSAL